tara:strand:+ start:1460 stop:1999 length:540 start_codon:yes stop_codon:yes gene_type:complete
MKKSFATILDKRYVINDTEELELFNINGYFPKEIFQLKNLRILKLRGSGLVGPIPNQIEKLKELNHLDLSHNKLSGFIPVELFNLNKLTSINLKSNFLNGIIPHEIGGIYNISHLDLSDNKLEGGLPSSICNLGKVWYINLTKNCLSGEVSEIFLEFVSKKKLPLSNIINGNNFNLNLS